MNSEDVRKAPKCRQKHDFNFELRALNSELRAAAEFAEKGAEVYAKV